MQGGTEYINTDNMKKHLFIFFVVICFNASGQTPAWLWAKSPTGGGNVPGSSSVVADGLGNSYMTGAFSSDTILFDLDTLINTDNSGTYDIYIAKYDVNGNVLWAKNFGGTYNDYGGAITIDSSGNIYITGTFSNTILFDSFSLTSVGSSDIFIVKYDINGNVIWAKRAGCNSIDYANSITTDAFGNLFISGSFRNTPITFDTFTLPNNGSADIFIAKYDQNGNALWAKSAGGTNDDGAPSVTTDGFGNSYIAVDFQSPSIIFGLDTLIDNNPSFPDVAIVKYDASGNVVWAKSAGGNNYDYAICVKTDSLNNIYMTGHFYSPSIIFDSDTLNNSSTNKDMFLVKFDNSGNVIWAKSAGGIGADQGSYLTTDSYNIYVVGYFVSTSIAFDTFILANSGSGPSDIFVVKYDSNGNTIWVKGANSIGDDYANSISIDVSGNMYVTGYFHNPSISFDSDTLINADTSGMTYKIFIAKINENIFTDTKPNLATQQLILVYPNPASNRICISGINRKTTIKIYGMFGNLILEKEIENDQSFDTEKFTSGIYTIISENNKGSMYNKIIICK